MQGCRIRQQPIVGVNKHSCCIHPGSSSGSCGGKGGRRQVCIAWSVLITMVTAGGSLQECVRYDCVQLNAGWLALLGDGLCPCLCVSSGCVDAQQTVCSSKGAEKHQALLQTLCTCFCLHLFLGLTNALALLPEHALPAGRPDSNSWWHSMVFGVVGHPTNSTGI